MFTIKEIVQATKGVVITGSTDQSVTGVSIDSRTIEQGEVFLAIKGECFDGHVFIPDVLKKGVSVLIIQKDQLQIIQNEQVRKQCVVVVVFDTIKALGDLAHFHRCRFSIDVIGVTGSTGKTTVKEMLGCVLASKYNVLKSERSYNNHIGLPLTLLKLKDHDICIAEMGTNHFGEIKYLTQILEPTLVVFTNIGNSHLKEFLTKKGVLTEKKEVLDSRSLRRCFLNSEDVLLQSLIEELHEKGIEYTNYGFNVQNPLQVKDLELVESGLSFKINEGTSVQLPVLGRHNVYNALAALSIGAFLGISLDSMSTSLATCQLADMRMQVVEKNGKVILNDAYNANPESMCAAIKVLQDHFPNKRKIAIIADMLELGDKTSYYHKKVGSFIAAHNIDYILCYGEKARICAQEAVLSGKDTNQVGVFQDKQKLFASISALTEEGDVILLKGSRRMKLEELVDAI